MSTKQRIQLVVAYDGTDFSGWAPQRGRRTVHGTLTEAVRQVSGVEIEITGASRTDSGAHALGQCVHLDDPVGIPPENWVRALNDRLPRDLRVVQASSAPEAFHARFWADSRDYVYRILIGRPDPLRGRFAFEGLVPLDLAAMREAAKPLVGEHDFRAFSQELPPEANSVRTLYAVEVQAGEGEARIEVRGTAFVRGMMRRIAGSLWEIGRGHRPVEWTRELIEGREPHRPVVLPAQGLTLVRVNYDEMRDKRERQTILNQQEDETDE